MKTHQVLDLTYLPEEGQECFCGTIEECQDFIATQSDYFMYRIVPLLEHEIDFINSKF